MASQDRSLDAEEFLLEKHLDCQERAQDLDFLVTELRGSLVVNYTKVTLYEVEDAGYAEVEPEADQDVLLDLEELLVVDQVPLLEQLGDVSQTWLLLLFDFASQSECNYGKETQLELLQGVLAHQFEVAIHYANRREESFLAEGTYYKYFE